MTANNRAKAERAARQQVHRDLDIRELVEIYGNTGSTLPFFSVILASKLTTCIKRARDYLQAVAYLLPDEGSIIADGPNPIDCV